jgi:hypothetical protein
VTDEDQIHVGATPRHDHAVRRRKDDSVRHTLTILRKENGRWRLARDANLLGPPMQQ